LVEVKSRNTIPEAIDTPRGYFNEGVQSDRTGGDRIMSRSAPIYATGLICLGLAGCALGGSAAPTTYDLIAPRSFAASAKPARYQLVVNEPTSVHALDTDRIMVRPRADQISYYKGAAWSDRLPHLVQVRTIETLQNSGAVKAVTSSSDRVDGDYSLSMEIRSFQVDTTNGRPAADVDIFAKLIDPRGVGERHADRRRRRVEPGADRGPARHLDLGVRPPLGFARFLRPSWPGLSRPSTF